MKSTIETLIIQTAIMLKFLGLTKNVISTDADAVFSSSGKQG